MGRSAIRIDTCLPRPLEIITLTVTDSVAAEDVEYLTLQPGRSTDGVRKHSVVGDDEGCHLLKGWLSHKRRE